MPFTKKYENPNNIEKKWVYAYSRAAAQARFYKQEWAFTLETWYDMWDQSGVKEHRGNKPHQYVMVRKDEIEAWGPHNCIIMSRRTHLKKHCYERLHKRQPITDLDDSYDVRNRRKV